MTFIFSLQFTRFHTILIRWN